MLSSEQDPLLNIPGRWEKHFEVYRILSEGNRVWRFHRLVPNCDKNRLLPTTLDRIVPFTMKSTRNTIDAALIPKPSVTRSPQLFLNGLLLTCCRLRLWTLEMFCGILNLLYIG